MSPHDDVPCAPDCAKQAATTPSSTSTSPPGSSVPAMASSSASNIPTTARSRVVKLMDLSDEVISQIFAALLPLGMRRRFIVFGPPAFPLALTCTRLFRLFQTYALRKIDAVHPEAYGRVPTRVLDGQVSERMMATIVRLAGANLRALHLCPHMPGINLVLDEVINHRVALREFSYSRGSEPIDEDKENAVFELMGSLHKLTVRDPRGALRFMHHAENLKALHLSSVCPNAFPDLFNALRQVGPSLIIFRIGFNLPDSLSMASHHYAGFATPIWCVRSFVTHISSRMTIDLPNLEVLDVSASNYHKIWHQHRIDELNMSITSAVAQFGDLIRCIRERNALSKSSARLRRVTIRATFGDPNTLAFKCLHLFRSMITPNIDVAVHCAGMTVVFPAKTRRPRFESLQVALQDLEASTDLSHIDCTRIETLDVGTGVLSTAYAAHESIRKKVTNLVRKSTDTLTEVQAQINVDSSIKMKNVCRYVADILELTPKVHTLALRSSVVDFCGQVVDSFSRLLDMMGDIRILILSTHPEYDSESMLSFIKNLPFFLQSVATACPKLECLHMEFSLSVLVVAFAPPEEREMEKQSFLQCEAAVRALEKALPYCDVTSLWSHLTLWQRRLYPSAWGIPF
eukprot:GFKZ01005975.1.p1 GENE.GFKZ01005975.1~~GFKZ01005975.1.p1  ORF type:complete len:629 (-),score=36.67 GFKZ01005975.1:344-2230(-)